MGGCRWVGRFIEKLNFKRHGIIQPLIIHNHAVHYVFIRPYLIFDPAWGAAGTEVSSGGGFGGEDGFDEFLSMQAPPVPQSTPARVSRAGSADSDETPDFRVVIK